MKTFYSTFIVLFITFHSFSQEKISEMTSDVTTYYFIRHAEKDRSIPSERNPHLTEEGLERAENWNKILGAMTFDAVYSTDYYRTKETAQPIADKNHLEITIYNPNQVDVNAFNKETMGKTVLIVGHSNTIPDFVNLMIGQKKYENIEDDNNGNLYIVSIIGDMIINQVFTIN